MVSALSHDDYVGRIAIGRVTAGVLEKGPGFDLQAGWNL